VCTDFKTKGECTAAELGQSGTTFRCRTDTDGWEVTTFLAQTILTVPAGTFTKAYLFRKHIERNNGSMSPDWDVYIVPGVGLVKQVEYDGNFREGQSAPGVARVIELVRVTTVPQGSGDGARRTPLISAETAAEPSANRSGGRAGELQPSGRSSRYEHPVSSLNRNPATFSRPQGGHSIFRTPVTYWIHRQSSGSVDG